VPLDRTCPEDVVQHIYPPVAVARALSQKPMVGRWGELGGIIAPGDSARSIASVEGSRLRRPWRGIRLLTPSRAVLASAIRDRGPPGERRDISRFLQNRRTLDGFTSYVIYRVRHVGPCVQQAAEIRAPHAPLKARAPWDAWWPELGPSRGLLDEVHGHGSHTRPLPWADYRER
jgi:hypothetical protein